MGKLEDHEIVAELKRMAKELDGKTPTLREFMARSKISRRQIDKYGYNKLVEKAGLEVNFNPFQHHTLQARAPKVLVLDIETSQLVVKTFGIRDQFIDVPQIKKDWVVLSWAAKWLGDEGCMYEDVRKTIKRDPKTPDRRILRGIHKLLSECDIVITHNGDSFDLKKLNARFIKVGLPPVSPYRSVDTLKIARRYFKFTSNKLEYLAQFLECEIKKSKHSSFLGRELWDECEAGNLAAFEELQNYNCTDVEVLELVYKKLVPYDNSLSFSAFHQVNTCVCGSRVFKKDGFKYTARGAFQRYACNSCGKIHIDRANLIEKDIRRDLM